MPVFSREGAMAVTQTRQLCMTRFTPQLRRAQLARRRGRSVAAVAKADLGDSTVRVALNLYSALQVRDETAVTRIRRLRAGWLSSLLGLKGRLWRQLHPRFPFDPCLRCLDSSQELPHHKCSDSLVCSASGYTGFLYTGSFTGQSGCQPQHAQQ